MPGKRADFDMLYKVCLELMLFIFSPMDPLAEHGIKHNVHQCLHFQLKLSFINGVFE